MTSSSSSVSTPNLQSPREELLNTITHGVGALLSVAGLLLMLAAATAGGDPWTIVASAVFGVALVLLYLTSSVYHALPVGPTKELFRSFDHMGVYLLIAGSCTVFCLTALRDSVGWGLVGAQWSIAAAGITLKSIYGPERFNAVSTLGYVIMGWMVMAFIGDIVEQVSTGGVVLLILGGVLYTLGVPFFLLDQKKKYFHTVWHLFVMAGSVCHFFMAYLYLIQ